MKTWRWSKKAVSLLLLAIMLIVVAGCQAMGGVDFNQMLKQAVKVTSFEGNETFEFKLLLKDDALKDIPAEEAELLDLVSNIKLQLNDMKVSDDRPDVHEWQAGSRREEHWLFTENE